MNYWIKWKNVYDPLKKLCPNLMNLSRVSNPQKPVSIEHRLKSWKILYNFQENQPYLSRGFKFFKFGLWILNSRQPWISARLILIWTTPVCTIVRLHYCSFELLFIWTTDMTTYPVVLINTLLAHLNYFSTNSVFKFFYNYEIRDHTIN